MNFSVFLVPRKHAAAFLFKLVVDCLVEYDKVVLSFGINLNGGMIFER